MKRAKNLLSLVLALALCLCFAPAAFAMVEQSDSFYVADEANVLSDSTEQMIIRYNGALEQQCRGAQIVVVTVGYLDGMNSDEYAYQLFNDWGVGSAEYNNGMLLLLAVNENKAWLAYGLGLNAQLSGSEVDELLSRYFWTDFDNGNYDSAVTRLFNALLRFYDGLYGTSLSTASDTQSVSQSSQYGYSGVARLVRLLVILAILFALFGGGGRGGYRGGSWLPWLLFFNAAGRNRGYRGGGGWPPRGGGGFGGGGFGGGFGGGMGRGGGGFSGGGGGRR